jgi:hypothetical protein
MLNSVEAAVSTLEEAGAVSYIITQVPNLKLTGEADNPQNLIDKFLQDWEKLTPGIYKVEHSKNVADRRSGLCFRISKVAPAVGSPAALAGIGGPNDLISGLQQQIWNLQTAAQIRDIEDRHRDELRKYKEKDDEGGLGVLAPLIGKLPEIQNIIYMATGRTPLNLAAPAVAGPAPAAPAEVGAPTGNEQRLAASLEQLQAGLGDELLLEVLGKLASKDPGKLRQLAGMIDML